MTAEKHLRKQLADFLDWKSAHVGFDDVVKGIPIKLRGAVPKGFAHSIWQVVEHIRLAQHDILDFSRNPNYEEMKWPDDYWPKSPVPKSPAAWTRALAEYRLIQRLVVNPRTDLLGKIPHGSGQTVLREVLLVADHTAYHVAQILDLRRAPGLWP